MTPIFRDHYLINSVSQAENFIDNLNEDVVYTPAMVMALIEAYLSVNQPDIAFGRLIDAKRNGFTNLEDLHKIYVRIVSCYSTSVDQCSYIVNELWYAHLSNTTYSMYRYDMRREGVPIKDELAAGLVQCCLRTGQYDICAEILREWKKSSPPAYYLSNNYPALHKNLINLGLLAPNP